MTRWIMIGAIGAGCKPVEATDEGESSGTETVVEPGPGDGCGTMPAGAEIVPLKEAKLNIEHNATDADSGFQGAIDSEGWSCLEVIGPNGRVLTFKADGTLEQLGVTELFFETVEPANADVPLAEVLASLPEGDYLIEGPGMEVGESTGWTSGTAWLTHDIPAGPVLILPAEAEQVAPGEIVFEWAPVSQTIDGDPITIISYQLIVEKDEEPHPHRIGKRGLQMYLPSTTTSMTIAAGFLEPSTPYNWEVLAIEESGNQTLSSGTFATSP